MLFILCERFKPSKKWHLLVFCLIAGMTLRFHEIFLFEIGIYYGNVTENGTAGMMVMTMTAVDYDDAEEGNWLFQILKSPKIGKKRHFLTLF